MQHFARLQGNRAISSLKTQSYCSLCLIRTASLTLDCSHRLCQACVRGCFSELEPNRYRLTICFLCQRGNRSVFAVKPPTAGIRRLELGGTDPLKTLAFLQELKRRLELAIIPLWEFFDLVVASKIGKHSISSCLFHFYTNRHI